MPQLGCDAPLLAAALQASVQHAASGLLPAGRVRHVVLYASEPEAQAAAEAFLSSCGCPQHVVEVEVCDPSPQGAEPAAAAAGAAAGAALPLPPKQQQERHAASRLPIGHQSGPGAANFKCLSGPP